MVEVFRNHVYLIQSDYPSFNDLNVIITKSFIWNITSNTYKWDRQTTIFPLLLFPWNMCFSQSYFLAKNCLCQNYVSVIAILLVWRVDFGSLNIFIFRLEQCKILRQGSFDFLSPARRGRGILVAPGFCPASGVRRHVFLWAQKLKNYWSTPNFFVGAKTTKLKKINYSNFTITFPTIGRYASDFFRVLLKFKMAAMDKLHIFCGRKNWKIEISNNSHCTITLPTIWKCACDFTEI